MNIGMGITLSVAAALAYGVTHFANGLLAKRISGIVVAALAQVGGTLIIFFAVPFFPTTQVTFSAWFWGFISGVGSISPAFLYRGMGKGKISVVAPVSEVCATGLPVLFGLAIGERLGLRGYVAMTLAFIAIWAMAAVPRHADGPGAASSANLRGRRTVLDSGVADGMLGGFGIAVVWVALSEIPAEAGLWPLVLSRVVSLVGLCALAVSMGLPLRAPSRVFGYAAAAGALGTVATTLYMFAVQHETISVATMVTALYPAVTVLLALMLLREKVSARQAVGLTLAASALILFSL